MAHFFHRLTILAVLGFVALLPQPDAQANLDPVLLERFHSALRLEEGMEVEVPFSLVVRGGVSLGVYESGVNWAILRLLRDLADDPDSRYRPELVAAAGASAGAINGFLAGLLWCSQSSPGDALDTLDANLIRDAWQRTDIEALLAHGPDAQDEDRAAFSRQVLRDVQDEILEQIRAREFRDGCQVAFGLTLTRAIPVVTNSASVEVEQQRLVVPLVMTAQDGDIALRNLAVPPPVFGKPDDTDLDNRPFRNSVIYLDSATDDSGTQKTPVLDATLDPLLVFDAIKASSAFPVAFAPQKLSYCIYKSEPLRAVDPLALYGETTPDARCPDNYQRLTSYFVDGGVFDNDPLGVVRQLAEINAGAGADIQYVKIDPDYRRAPAGRFRFSLPPYAEPGDSLEIGLWAGNSRTGKADGQPAMIGGQRFREVTIQRCSITTDPAICGDSRASCRYDNGKVSTRLIESAPNSQYFIGSIHTRPDVGVRSMTRSAVVVPVEPVDRLLLIADGETTAIDCATLDTDRENDPLKRRTIGIVDRDPAGLSTQLEFVAGAVSSARGYRLYDELLRNSWRDGVYDNRSDGRPILQPSRLTSLTGDFLLAFGAFLDQRFRQYDYYAGVYDAVFGISEWLCESSPAVRGSKSACRAAAAKQVYLQLCAPDASEPMRVCRETQQQANVVIRQLVRLEVCGAGGLAGTAGCTAAELGCGPDESACELGEWSWVEALAPDAPTLAAREVELVGAALQVTEAEVRDTDRSPFVRFIKVMSDKREDLFDRDRNTLLGRMLSRPNGPVPTWYHPVTSVVIPELVQLQRDDRAIRARVGVKAGPGSSVISPALAISGLVAETVGDDAGGWNWENTSVPDSATRRWRLTSMLLFSEVSFDAASGGPAAFWNPGWRFENGFGIDLRIAPYQHNSVDGGNVEFSEIAALLRYRLSNPFLTSLSVGPSWSHTWNDEPGKSDNLGAVASFGLIGDKFKVTYGVRSFSDGQFAGYDNYWYLGLNDVPGIAYWLFQGR